MVLTKVYVALGVVLFLGAGCAATQPIGNNSSDYPTMEQTDETNNTATTAITLTGTTIGRGAVKLEWSANDTTAEQAEKWWIIGGYEENPSYPGTDFVFERGSQYREKEWRNLRPGITHFRVCAVIDNVCVAYSNNFMINIPSTQASQGK